MRKISPLNSIVQYLHCKRCIEEMPGGYSPATWAQLSVGFTKLGVQVWCLRHEINVVHIDFQGAKHPANVLSYNHEIENGFKRGRFTKHRPDPSKIIGLVSMLGGKELEPTTIFAVERLEEVARKQGIELKRPIKIKATFLPAWKRWAKELGYTILVTRKAVRP